MPKNITKYRKKTLVYAQLENDTDYRYGTTGYGRIVWGVIITLSIIVICISVASAGGTHAW
ncbi:hypothetical protein AAEO56_08070 [Flavobacterium sp. DGU11]|uniref:Uncharacterized protein n=1 Tax=Flavobacterium arundinis TaxID=3139143 RepID=A0ABU9HW53_9FLAO